MHESPLVKEALDSVIGRKLPQVIVDLSGVSYIDSSGLAVFIEALQRTQGYGGKLALCGLTPSVRAIFDIARLNQIFDIYADRSAATAAQPAG